jgi:hypothetical protein
MVTVRRRCAEVSVDDFHADSRPAGLYADIELGAGVDDHVVISSVMRSSTSSRNWLSCRVLRRPAAKERTEATIAGSGG